MHEHAVSCGLSPLAAAALVALAAVGCDVTTSPSPAGAMSLVRPPVFAEWWQEVEQCSGATGDLGRVAWYVAPCQAGESGFRCDVTQNGLCAGEWQPPHTITLAGPNRFFPDGYVDDEWTVKHEMLHDLLGTSEHPAAFTVCHLQLR